MEDNFEKILEEMNRKKKRKPVVWTDEQIQVLASLVYNHANSIRAIVKACAGRGVFKDKSKYAIQKMAKALRDREQSLPFEVEKD